MTSTAFHLEALDEGLGSGQLHDFLFGGSDDSGREKPLAVGEGRGAHGARGGGRALRNYYEEVGGGHHETTIA